MKSLSNIIYEKLHLGKQSHTNTYTLYYGELDGDNFEETVIVELPFKLNLPELDDTIEVHSIEKSTNEYDEPIYKFYDERNRHLFNLSSLMGIENLFVKSIKDSRINCAPKIYSIHGKQHMKRETIRIEDPDKTIVKESLDEQKVYANMILLNPTEDAVLILRRANYMRKFKGMYGFPGGSVDKKDKDSKAAAIRELKEETGISLSFNEENKCKKFDTITNSDGSISEYYITTLESDAEVKISKEHAAYEWFNEESTKNHKWMPDVFQIIQKIL